MVDFAFDPYDPNVGAKALDTKLVECRGGIYVRADFAACRTATNQFLDQVLTLPPSEQRRHLERAQAVNEETVHNNPLYLMPQLDIVFSRSTEKLSDFKLQVPEMHRVITFDLFDP